MKKLKHWFPAAVLLSLAATLTAVAADPPPPDVTLPPNEQPKAFIAFAKAQSEDVIDWTLKDVGIPEVWEKGITGKGGVGGVIDTGTDATHPDLVGQVLSGQDFTRKGSWKDGNGHGIWCFGHIFAKKDGKGVVGGAYGAKGRAYKVLSDQGSGYNSDITKGIDQAVVDGCDVISLSLGSSQPDPLTLAALARARDAGVMCVIAAGNDGPKENTVGYPGGYAAAQLPLIVCVAAHDSRGVTADFSSRGKAVTLTLGGVDAQSTWKDNAYASIDGTSMATPTAASLFLLWLEAGGNKLPKKDRPAAFLDALIRSCDQYPKRDTARGFGKPNAVKLIATVPQPPAPPAVGRVTITLDSLTPQARASLLAAGVTDLSITLGTGTANPVAVPRSIQADPLPGEPMFKTQSAPVQGYWNPPIQEPWYVPTPNPVPQAMPQRTCPPQGCPPAPQWVPGQLIRGRWIGR